MPNLNSLGDLHLFLGSLVPGLIILFVRSQFVTGRHLSPSAALLSYLAVSFIYHALALPFVLAFAPSIHEPGYVKVLSWYALTFVGPAVFGILLGVNVQRDWFRRVLQRCCLNPVHPMPTAWDWKFGGNSQYQWVLVTLKDDTRFAGFYGPESFSSSDPDERDIYLERIYDIDDKANWSPRGENGVLIASDEIQTIEFWPYKENTHDQS